MKYYLFAVCLWDKPKAMKRIILSVLITAALISCKKDNPGNCYDCTFGTVNGVTPPPQEYCGDMPHNFTDAQGNPLSSFCVPK